MRSHNLENKSSPLVFSQPDIQLYHADSFRILDELPPEKADIIFADPPYNLSNGGSTCHSGKRVCVNKGTWDKSNGVEEDYDFHYKWIKACKRVLKPEGTIWISGTYHNIYACGHILQTEGWHLLNDIIWYKPNAAPNLACRMFTASHETILWAKKNKNSKHYFDYERMKATNSENDIFKNSDKQMRSVWSISTPSNKEKIFGKHPTQKPLALLERIILSSCPPAGLVIDPFCGSGTSGVAAIRQGRRYIGIDINYDYIANLAIPRLEQALYDRKLWKET